jgi:DNA-binding NarL/FixJ family response regulator
MFTVHDECGFIRVAIAAGAAGYVEKRAVDTELVAAIRAVAQGRSFMDVSSLAIRAVTTSPASAQSASDLSRLSGREREILERVAEGYTNREISDDLGLSVKSVEAYRARLMAKLGLRSRVELVRFALDCGVLRPGKLRTEPAAALRIASPATRQE